MRLDTLLNAHAFMRVERPPEHWEIDGELEEVVRLLGEPIAFGLSFGGDLGIMTLNASNVVVDPNASSERLASGEYVAVTVRGPGEWGPELTLVARRARHLQAGG